MALKFQNPNDANVVATLDSDVAYPNTDASTTVGSKEVRREILIIGDITGTNVMPQFLANQRAMLAELRAIRRGIAKLVNDPLLPDMDTDPQAINQNFV